MIPQSTLGIAALLATLLLASSSTKSASAFSIPPIVEHSPSLQATAHVSSTTQLSLAFLPDEDRQLPQPDDDDKEGNSSVAEDTLNSLVEKLDQSKQDAESKKKDNKSMAFLKKIGRVGGAANKSFVNAVGSDEGSTGRQPPADRATKGAAVPPATRKSKLAYKECTVTGVVDDLTEPFPLTSSGNEWRGITDRVMGGRSNGMLERFNDLNGRPANVLEGHVSLANNGGFLQMVTDLPLDASNPSVDASDYDGIELDVLYRKVEKKSEIVDEEIVEDTNPGVFNMHVRTPGTFQQASYRYTFKIAQENTWETIRVPFDQFEAYGGGPNMPEQLPPSELRRIGIVGIGREMDLFLAVGGLRFYSVI